MKDIKAAEKLCRRIFKDFYKNKRIKHSERVVKLCEDYAKKLNIKGTDRAVLIKAAWLHDVGRIIDKEKHNEVKIIKNVFKIYKYDDSDKEDIIELISNHKGKFCPARLKLRSAILRICDKIDKLNVEMKNCEDNLSEIDKELEGKKSRKDFEKITKKILKNVGNN
ncbi:HD domain-containing protein [Anaerovibrio lipolyticus DSM 3074]|uniref:HD domain-containing protein n=1 Tax=Anaerovibrio lipolyticus DSM 3074 TaxID=1120997 RepID=A0A1M6G5Y4_9FIRM|nr:HD domain-containing protein [Anaerovibrio lipolyticus]SHJ05333.1 HD domain-containing protein [Anaerovibrio lipolyticus DSM 3074]